MAKYFIIENAHELGQRCVAGILGGYDSPDTDRFVVVLRYSDAEWIQSGDYRYMPESVSEPEVLTFNN